MLAQVEYVIIECGQRVPANASLNCDGMMVTAGTSVSSPTPWRMQRRTCWLKLALIQERNVCFLDAVRKAGAEKAGAVQLQDLDAAFWRSPGMRLPFHLAVVTGLWDPLYKECKRWLPPAVVPASWRHWDGVIKDASADGARGALVPVHGLAIPEDGHAFLLNCLGVEGQPCSAAVLPTPSGAWQVVLGSAAWVIERSALLAVFEDAVDRKAMVSFHVAARPRDPSCQLDLQVQA